LRLAARTDANQAEILAAAKPLGVWITVIGWPVDLLVAHRGNWYLVELKSAKGRYTPSQEEFIHEAQARQAQVYTWRSVDDLIAFANRP
jgi:hypothetical protein